MTMNRTVGEKEIIVGTVVARYLPGWKTSKSGKDYLASGKLVLESEDGVSEISFMQLYVNDERSDTLMPQIWNDIDDNIKGKEVAIACTFESDFTNPTTGAVKHQFRKPTSIKYLNPGDAPPQASAQTTQVAQTAVAPPTVAPTTAPMATPAPQSFSLDERIAWNSAVNNAVTATNHHYGEEQGHIDRYTPTGWLSRVEAKALLLYPLIRRGPVEPVQITPEEELFPEATDLGLSGEII